MSIPRIVLAHLRGMGALVVATVCAPAFAQWSKDWQPIEDFEVRVNRGGIVKQADTRKGGTGIVVGLWIAFDLDKPIKLDNNPTPIVSVRQRISIYCDDRMTAPDETWVFSGAALSGTLVTTKSSFGPRDSQYIAPGTYYAVLADRYCNRWKVWQ